MIKIIFSATFDGFYPRYASDENLDDLIAQHLIDRRRFLSKSDDRLYKEGYSIQQVPNEGVLFHKIMLLFDGFGRDGFAMASLFLPRNTLLGGIEIKDALDAVLNEYKLHTVNGVANIEVDWSFIKTKANELNEKVQNITWSISPRGTESAQTALLQGAENRVADFFQYPNPLNRLFGEYSQVFLTESLLDPGMGSDNGEQGYVILPKDSIDIDNPTYKIKYNNPNGYNISSLRTEVTKKELLSPNGFNCGTLVAEGYRSSRQVIIKDKNVKNNDGVWIEVDLPKLTMKEAFVELSFKGANGHPVTVQPSSIQWDYKTITLEGGKYHFQGTECDRTWNLTINADGYEFFSESIYIGDRQALSRDIVLKKRTSRSLGWDELDALGNGSSTRGKKAVMVTTSEPTVLYLKLNPKSRKYSLFRNQSKKNKLQQSLDASIRELEGCLDALSESLQSKKIKPRVEKIGKHLIDSLKNHNLEGAKSSLEALQGMCKFPDKGLTDKAKKTVAILKKYCKIPLVVKNKNVEYDVSDHALKTSSENPNPTKLIFERDMYSYQIVNNLSWNDNYTYAQTHIVKRSIRLPYVIMFIVGVLAILSAVAYGIWGRSNPLDGVTASMHDCIEQLSSEFSGRDSQRYYGDNHYQNLNRLNAEYLSNGGEVQEPFYKEFKSLLDKQSELRHDDSIFMSAMHEYKETGFQAAVISTLNLSDTVKLSREHSAEVQKIFSEMDAYMGAEMEMNEENAFAKCTTLEQCNTYLTNFPDGKHRQEVMQKKVELQKQGEEALYKKCMGANATANLCDQYLRTYPQGAHVKEVKAKLAQLQQSTSSAQSTTSTPATSAEPTKQKISTKTQLFYALTWDNVKDNGEKFKEKFEVATSFLEKRAKNIIERANKIGEASYKEARKAAPRRWKKDGEEHDILYYLEPQPGNPPSKDDK